jgi:2-oxoisovalerate dehydrogenase E1 component
MRLSRELDQRFEALRLGGRVAKWYSAIGNEATTVPAGLALEPGDVLSTIHRDLGAILATYLDPVRTFPGEGFEALARPRDRRPEPEQLLRRLACQLLGKDEGFSRGIERSFHYGLLDEEHDLRHVGMISHLGSMIPVAAGCAFALARRASGGRSNVAINFIGDGGTSTGDFHEGLNMAAVWKLPFVLVIENNRYAFATPTGDQYACQRLSDRGPGYGVPAITVDGNDPEEVERVLREGLEHARSGRGPVLIEAMVGRMRGHSEGDDSLKVVPADELARYLAADPVPAYAARLRNARVLDEESQRQLDRRAKELVEEALEYGLAAAPPPPEIAWRPVFAVATSSGEESDESGRSEGGEPAAAEEGVAEAPAATSGAVFYVDAIHRALEEEMERDSSVVLLGQDIGRFEGAFRVTRGLHERWAARVLDTPIAESGTLGIAAGAALLGLRPIVEMQFADFVSCGFNQLVNVAAKLYYRFERPCPIVVRLPSGGGVGAGAFHSQNPEGWFTHVAGLKVVCPATAEDAYALLLAAIRDPNPVIFCEHKFLYRRVKASLAGVAPEPLGRAVVRRAGDALTLVGYGATTWTCLEAAEELARQGFEAEVVDLRTLVPFDEETVLASVKKTGRAIVVYEAQLTSGFGAEIAARIADAAFPWLDAPVKRVAFADRPVPYVKALEKELSPTKERVLAAAEVLLRY